jgi:hypothetical protein
MRLCCNRQEGKRFFFEKKDQKTFVRYGLHRIRPFGPAAGRHE